jgi:hypothetical protein
MALARYHRIVTESKNVRRRFPQRKTACVSAIRQKTINAYAAEAFCEVLLRWRLARIDLHESSMCFLTKLFHSHRLFPREEFQIDEFSDLPRETASTQGDPSPSLSAPQVTKVPRNARRMPRVPGALLITI